MLRRTITIVALIAALSTSVLAGVAQASMPGNSTLGKELFVRAGLFCASCHTLKATGSNGRDGPNLDRTRPSYPTIIEVVTKGRKPSRRWPTGMPGYTGPHGELGKAQIQDLAAFVYDATHG